METSLFLAKLIGIMMVIMGLFVLLMPGRIQAIAEEFLDSPALMFVAGILAMVSGLAIILSHNNWSADWQGLITLLGWIFLLAGFGRVAMPDVMKATGQKMLQNRILITVPALLMTGLGCYLAWIGFGL